MKSCSVQAFKDQDGEKARRNLFEAIDHYFRAGASDDQADEKIRCTSLPPIYFQYPGHSLTIVGIEHQKNGQPQLLVFDPAFRDSNSIMKLIGKEFKGKSTTANNLAQAYRRDDKYLRRHREFEVL